MSFTFLAPNVQDPRAARAETSRLHGGVPMNAASALRGRAASRGIALLRLGKPAVVSLIVFTAIIGMFLATPGLPAPALGLYATAGIGLVATSAAALNCLLERHVDRVMARTRARPLVREDVSVREAGGF